MSKTTIGRFSFEVFKRTKDMQLPMHPFVRLCLKRWGDTVGGPTDSPALSPQLMTEQEIDRHIDELKEDLEKVRSEAKRALRKAVIAHGADPSKD